jgi:hypothetical protein
MPKPVTLRDVFFDQKRSEALLILADDTGQRAHWMVLGLPRGSLRPPAKPSDEPARRKLFEGILPQTAQEWMNAKSRNIKRIDKQHE